MYNKFYGLKDKPFEITPDPRYLYLSESHREALAHLTYALNESKGFTVITGEVGTGKTTLVQMLLSRLDSHTRIAHLFNPKLGTRDFFKYICQDFGLKTDGFSTKGEFLTLLHSFLMECYARRERVVLIVDEAHTLSPALLEEVRLITNLETPKAKLLQVILLGQPELDDDACPERIPAAQAADLPAVQPQAPQQAGNGGIHHPETQGGGGEEQRPLRRRCRQGDLPVFEGYPPAHQRHLRQLPDVGLRLRKASYRQRHRPRGHKRHGGPLRPEELESPVPAGNRHSRSGRRPPGLVGRCQFRRPSYAAEKVQKVFRGKIMKALEITSLERKDKAADSGTNPQDLSLHRHKRLQHPPRRFRPNRFQVDGTDQRPNRWNRLSFLD